MNNEKTQLGEVQEAIAEVHRRAQERFPVSMAYPIGCEERAKEIDAGMADVKKRFPKAFK